MLFSTAMSASRPSSFLVPLAASLLLSAGVAGCKRSDPPANPLKTQREAMERAKDVGKTMQKAVDQEGRKADEEGR